MVMMWLSFIFSNALLLHAADMGKNDLNAQEQTHRVAMSKSDAEALQFLRTIESDSDMDLLRQLAQPKMHSTAASGNRKKRMPRRGGKHAQRGIRQLQASSKNETADPLVA